MRDEMKKDDRTITKMKWKATLNASPAFNTINGAKNECSAEVGMGRDLSLLQSSLRFPKPLRNTIASRFARKSPGSSAFEGQSGCLLRRSKSAE